MHRHINITQHVSLLCENMFFIVIVIDIREDSNGCFGILTIKMISTKNQYCTYIIYLKIEIKHQPSFNKYLRHVNRTLKLKEYYNKHTN